MPDQPRNPHDRAKFLLLKYPLASRANVGAREAFDGRQAAQ